MPPKPQKTVILVGAGYANLQIMLRARDFQQAGAKLLLISPDCFWYSANMATEVLSGHYGVRDFRVNLGQLADRHGVEFICDEIAAILPEHRKILTQGGRTLDYDLAAFALGSVPLMQEGDVPVDGSFPVSPICNFIEIRNEVETLLEFDPDKELSVLVLGGGASGVETALNLAALLRERSPAVGWRLTLLEAKDRVLPAFSQQASKAAALKLERAGIRLRTAVEILHVQSGRVVLEYGETLDFDLAVVALGLRPAGVIERSGLFTDEEGALVVDRTLRSTEYPELFAAGDCARIVGLGPNRFGLQAAAQGAVLARNLLAILEGHRRLKIFRSREPRWHFISLGPYAAMAVKGNRVWCGRLPLWLKHWQDRRSLRPFRALSVS